MFSRDNCVVFVMVKKNYCKKSINQLFNKEKVVFSFWKVNIIIRKVNTVSGRNNF